MCPFPNCFRDEAISLYVRTTHHIFTVVTKCIDVDGGILENLLNCEKLCHLNNKYRY
jgi:hypothetical protein